PRAGVRQRITQTEVLNAAPHRVLRTGHRARVDLRGPGRTGGPGLPRGLPGGGGCCRRGRRRVLPGFDPATGLLHTALPPLSRCHAPSVTDARHGRRLYATDTARRLVGTPGWGGPHTPGPGTTSGRPAGDGVHMSRPRSRTPTECVSAPTARKSTPHLA